jgi:hypothetical protein
MDSEWSDFEDALQYFAAVHGRADCIITRNPADFRVCAIAHEDIVDRRQRQDADQAGETIFLDHAVNPGRCRVMGFPRSQDVQDDIDVEEQPLQ